MTSHSASQNPLTVTAATSVPRPNNNRKDRPC